MLNKLPRVALIVIAAVLVAFAGCKSGADHRTAAGQSDVAAAAPPESKLQIQALDGGNVSLDQYKGKVVLVNFWATWCQPCRIEIPWLIEFDKKYGSKGLVILGVAMDDEGKKAVDPWITAQRFDVNGQKEAISYRILLGSDKIADKFGGVIGLPTSMLYSREGKKVKTIIGLINYDDINKALQSQL